MVGTSGQRGPVVTEGRAIGQKIGSGVARVVRSLDDMNKVQPGDVLELHVTVKRPGGKIWKFTGEARVDGQLVAEAAFTAMMDLKSGGSGGADG